MIITRQQDNKKEENFHFEMFQQTSKQENEQQQQQQWEKNTRVLKEKLISSFRNAIKSKCILHPMNYILFIFPSLLEE